MDEKCFFWPSIYTVIGFKKKTSGGGGDLLTENMKPHHALSCHVVKGVYWECIGYYLRELITNF